MGKEIPLLKKNLFFFSADPLSRNRRCDMSRVQREVGEREKIWRVGDSAEGAAE